MPIIVCGSLNHDLVTHTSVFPQQGETVTGNSFQSHLGGKGLNEAVACAKLKSPSDKFSVKLFGALGDDPVADEFVRYLTNVGVKTDLISKIKGQVTGTATIIVEDNVNAENRIIVVSGANGKFTPSREELDAVFKMSNMQELQSSIENVDIPSHVHSHSTKPPFNEPIAKTLDVSPHPPSNIHSHGSMSSLNRSNGSESGLNGLVLKNGQLIHEWSASGTNLAQQGQLQNQSGISLHSHATRPRNESVSSNSSLGSHKFNDIQVSKITGSVNHNDQMLPSNLHAHSSSAKMDTLTYPSPKPSAIDLQNAAIALASKQPVPNRSGSNLNLTAQARLANVSFSLGGSSAHPSNVSLSPSQTYLSNIRNPVPNSKPVVDDLKYYLVIQNEIPNPHTIIDYVSKNYTNVQIMYNPSPLPNAKDGYNSSFLDSLLHSTFVVMNEHELANIVANFHPNPASEPMTVLKNVSNYEPSSEFELDGFVKQLTKLKSFLTKPNVIVTLGEAGILYSIGGQFTYAYVPSEEVDEDDIVDTTGAGDTFLGAVTTCLYRGESLESAIKFAARASAETIKKSGAAEAMPRYGDVERRGWAKDAEDDVEVWFELEFDLDSIGDSGGGRFCESLLMFSNSLVAADASMLMEVEFDNGFNIEFVAEFVAEFIVDIEAGLDDDADFFRAAKFDVDFEWAVFALESGFEWILECLVNSSDLENRLKQPGKLH
ncbi:hypothetical protein JL09_g3307 [Pichia kudriavzevii]|uniref:Ribokinase n=1 Tax=Pichia kudriavzevii TaxID=4909 RepID=A0A099NXI9_PICKU|nr:hypothetical protein JL09_g3307 [Pichia kudriavzevii]